VVLKDDVSVKFWCVKLRAGSSGGGGLLPRPLVCVLSFEAVARLREAESEARRIENGLPDWRQAGLPVVASIGSGLVVDSRAAET
jgi:hypothetical protein